MPRLFIDRTTEYHSVRYGKARSFMPVDSRLDYLAATQRSATQRNATQRKAGLRQGRASYHHNLPRNQWLKHASHPKPRRDPSSCLDCLGIFSVLVYCKATLICIRDLIDRGETRGSSEGSFEASRQLLARVKQLPIALDRLQ